MEALCKIIGVVVFFVAVLVGISALFALPVKWLWNGVMPDIFGLHTITFLQAWGLSILSGFLFKSHTTK